MKVFFRLSLIITLALGFFSQAKAQEMWPGDVNNNGVVNGVDLLYLGLAYNSEGPERTDGDTDWQAQPITAFWPQSFPNGLNYAYADADGDGEISDNDRGAVEDNFGLTHGTVTPDTYANAAPGTAPRIFLEPDVAIVQEGAMVNVALILGDADMPIENFYGIAFKLSYDTELLAGDDGLEYEDAENSWIAAGNGEIEELFISNEDAGTAELAITRTNQQPVSEGSGTIGSFSIIIEDIIVGLSIDTVRIRIDSVLLFDSELRARPLVPDSTEIIVAKDPRLVSTSTVDEPLQLSVFPNPGKGSFFLRSNRELSKLALFSQLGNQVPIVVARKKTGLLHIRAPEAPPGLYILAGQSAGQRFSQKIIIHP